MFSNMPIEADVSPLPSELTTPPVTKMCLAMKPFLALVVPWKRRTACGGVRRLRCLALVFTLPQSWPGNQPGSASATLHSRQRLRTDFADRA